MKLEINTPEEMFELGIKLAEQYKKILLHWDLWAGKTLLTKGFAKWLWLDENKVQSPTYAYLNSHWDKLLHMDMYRIETENDIWEKWINDQIISHDYIAIEWPKFVDTLDIDDYIEITIEKIWDQRIVEIK